MNHGAVDLFGRRGEDRHHNPELCSRKSSYQTPSSDLEREREGKSRLNIEAADSQRERETVEEEKGNGEIAAGKNLNIARSSAHIDSQIDLLPERENIHLHGKTGPRLDCSVHCSRVRATGD